MEQSENKYENLLAWASKRLGPVPAIKDSGRIARLKRADGDENLAAQAWEILFRFGIEEWALKPCLAVLAPMCRRDAPVDGTASLGAALASCLDKPEEEDLRLRRLLNCRDQTSLCAQLRPLLSFIDSKAKVRISYASLMEDVLAFRFPDSQERIKMRWARDYWAYGRKEGSDGDDA